MLRWKEWYADWFFPVHRSGDTCANVLTASWFPWGFDLKNALGWGNEPFIVTKRKKKVSKMIDYVEMKRMVCWLIFSSASFRRYVCKHFDCTMISMRIRPKKCTRVRLWAFQCDQEKEKSVQNDSSIWDGKMVCLQIFSSVLFRRYVHKSIDSTKISQVQDYWSHKIFLWLHIPYCFTYVNMHVIINQ